MSPTRISLILGTPLALGACASSANTPVVAYPGPSKDAVTFQKDETACRTAAAQAAHPTGSQASGTPQALPAPTGDSSDTNAQWGRYFATYAQCEASHGNSLQPVPWATAYAAYLGYGAPYAYGPGYAYGYPFFYGYPGYYGYPFFYGPYVGGFYAGFRGGFGGFHGGGFHH